MKNRLLVIAVIIVCLGMMSACGDQDSRMSGTFEGTSKVTRKSSYSSSPETVSTGKGTVTFKLLETLRLDDNMPLPNCNIRFRYETEAKEYRDTMQEFTGKDNNDGNGCKAISGTASSFNIRIINAKLSQGDKGEIILLVVYEAKDLPGGSPFELEFRGTKKGWF